MATGHTNTNKLVLSKLNEVLSTQDTTNNKVTTIDNRVTNINNSLPNITNSVNNINSSLSPISNTVSSIDSKTSQLTSIMNQIKVNTEQPPTKQYIPDNCMKYCGVDSKLASWLSDNSAWYYPVGALYNGEIHLVGGSYHIKWSPSTGWVTVSTSSAYGHYWVSDASMIVYNNQLYLLGGSSTQTTTNHYRWDGSKWSSVGALPFAFCNGCAIVYNNELHLLGSYSSGCGTYHYRWNGSSWANVSTLPIETGKASVVIYNDEIHLLGNGATNSKGYEYDQRSHYKWSYNFGWRTDTWLPVDLCDGGAVTLNGEIYIAGGHTHTDDGSKYSNQKIYTWSGNEWTSIGDSPYTFEGGLMLADNGTIHMIGGNNAKNYHYQLRPTYKTTMYLKANTFVTGNQLSIKGINDAWYSIRFGTSYRIQYDGVYYISASSGIMIS